MTFSVARPAAGPPSRRQILGGVAAGLIAAPYIKASAQSPRSLKVATFGGNFENGFKKFIFPVFEAATGIKVESVSEPADLAFLIQIIEANKSGNAPIDIGTFGQQDVIRGLAAKAWRPLSAEHMPHVAGFDPPYRVHDEAGRLVAVGAMGWYLTLIVNPDELKPPPDTWRVLWEIERNDVWGLSTGGDSPLFEIAAATWFGGNDILNTTDGIAQVIEKIRGLKSKTKVWWESEGTMQTAYENDEVIGGMYFNDVAHVMARAGTPVLSIFPKEGGVIDYGSWAQPAASTKVEEAEAFIDFMSMPATQSLMARKIGTPPLLPRAALDLTDAEFAEVSSSIPPIERAITARTQHLDFMDAAFNKMLRS